MRTFCKRHGRILAFPGDTPIPCLDCANEGIDERDLEIAALSARLARVEALAKRWAGGTGYVMSMDPTEAHAGAVKQCLIELRRAIAEAAAGEGGAS